jgi:uncharacterized protein (TIGR02145 family)
MKKALAILVFLAITIASMAQNVGIGTTAPASKLTILGTASNPTIPGTSSTGVLRVGRADSPTEGIDFGKSEVTPFSGWIQSGFNGNTSDPLSLQPLGGRVGIGVLSPNTSAVLDVSSTTQGFLPPRMTLVQRDAIANPAAGLIIFNTTTNSLEIRNSSVWVALSTPASTAVFLPTIVIGTQQWQAKNLDVAFYRNGDSIPQVSDPTAWAALTTGAWCYYNNDPLQGNKYGKLYNWYAVNDSRGLAPQGWHIPSDAEWTTLTTTLGGSSVAGGKMKESGTFNWTTPNTGADNSSGFAGLPGGGRFNDGTFSFVGFFGYWWSSTEFSSPSAWFRYLDYNDGSLGRSGSNRRLGFSVRCLRD